MSNVICLKESRWEYWFWACAQEVLCQLKFTNIIYHQIGRKEQSNSKDVFMCNVQMIYHIMQYKNKQMHRNTFNCLMSNKQQVLIILIVHLLSIKNWTNWSLFHLLHKTASKKNISLVVIVVRRNRIDLLSEGKCLCRIIY